MLIPTYYEKLPALTFSLFSPEQVHILNSCIKRMQCGVKCLDQGHYKFANELAQTHDPQLTTSPSIEPLNHMLLVIKTTYWQ